MIENEEQINNEEINAVEKPDVDDLLLTKSRHLDMIIGFTALAIVNSLVTWVIIVKFSERRVPAYLNGQILFLTCVATLIINLMVNHISAKVIKWKYVRIGSLYVIVYPLLYPLLMFGSCSIHAFYEKLIRITQ